MTINRAEGAHFTTYYQTWTYYCPVNDRQMTRISVPDPCGSLEYFAVVQNDGGKQYRAAREEALTMIEAAIEQGLPAGQVRWTKEPVA